MIEAPEVAKEQPMGARGFELPHAYGEDKLMLLVRDPWWIFAYWEVTPQRQAQTRQALEAQGLRQDKTVLRIYDITDADAANPHSYFDIELGFFANNWYVNVGSPDRQWMAELGLRASNGRFFALVRSNRVRTPRYGVSDVLDEEWLLPDELYWKIFGLSGGYKDAKSSLDVQDILQRYFRSVISSESSPHFNAPAAVLPEAAAKK